VTGHTLHYPLSWKPGFNRTWLVNTCHLERQYLVSTLFQTQISCITYNLYESYIYISRYTYNCSAGTSSGLTKLLCSHAQEWFCLILQPLGPTAPTKAFLVGIFRAKLTTRWRDEIPVGTAVLTSVFKAFWVVNSHTKLTIHRPAVP